MNLRDLEYLVAVLEHGHFGRAAAQCHVSQPTLSMQIKKLEEYLGVQLLERSGKKVMATAAGMAVAERARDVLRASREIRQLCRDAGNPAAGELRFGIFPTLAPYVLPAFVPPLCRKFPELRLKLVEEKSDNIARKLAAGELDCALLALPVENPQFETHFLFDDPFLLAVPKGHGLAGRKAVKVEEVAQEPMLLLEEGHCMRAQALSLCRLSENPGHGDFRATSLETLRHMVLAGVGVTLIPRTAVQKEDGITYIPFAEKTVRRRIALVMRKKSGRDATIQMVLAALKDILGKVPS